jgi:mRNA interferase RelE/StbE
VTWRVEVAPRAVRTLAGLDRAARVRVRRFLSERLETDADDPRHLGRPLSGPWAGLWRYRVGDYRLIRRIDDGRSVVLVLEIGHRREVYR